MFYTDSHIHLHDCNAEIIKNVITNAQKNNVKAFINVSSNPTDWNNVLAVAQQYEGVQTAIGVHPWCVENVFSDWKEKLERFLRKYPDLWIGECGIDRLKNPDTSVQLEIFSEHIRLAEKYNRPLIVHAVKANEQIENLFAKLPQKTIFHSFTGSKEWGEKIQKNGFYLGINCTILNKKNCNELLQTLDLRYLLLETDFPYQGKNVVFPNEPKNLPLLAQKIADIKKISVVELEDFLWQNWQQFIEKGEK